MEDFFMENERVTVLQLPGERYPDGQESRNIPKTASRIYNVSW